MIKGLLLLAVRAELKTHAMMSIQHSDDAESTNAQPSASCSLLAPDGASGCPKLRPTLANQPVVGPRWPPMLSLLFDIKARERRALAQEPSLQKGARSV